MEGYTMKIMKRVEDTFSGKDRKIVKLPTDGVEYYSERVKSGYGLGELEDKAEKFSVKRKPHKE